MQAGLVKRATDVDNNGKISVNGRIVGYSILSRLRLKHLQSTSAPHEAFLFLVVRGSKGLEAGKYVKIQYRVTAQHHKDLSPELFEESTVRSFILERDKSCDESTESFIYGNRFEELSSEDKKKFSNLFRLPGAEDFSLPDEQMLRCYSFDRDGIGK
jgi:hypothetical protein